MFRRAAQVGYYWPLVMILLLAGGTSFFGGVLWSGRNSVDERQPRPTKIRRRKNEETVVPEPEAAAAGRVVGEFEHQAAILLGSNELVEYHPKTLIEIVSALHGKVGIIGLVWDEQQRARVVALLKEHGLPDDAVDFFVWPAKSMWVRDFGPLFLVQGSQASVADYAYTPPNRDEEELFGVSLAATFGFPFERAELSFEGGNMLTNGDGLCISTNIVFGQNSTRGYDAQQICKILHEKFHFEKWTYLKPMVGEPTGHADMFVTFCAPNVAVVGQYDPDDDEANARILDENASLLEGAATKDGPMKVVRIRTPPHRDDIWRSYTNVIYANDTLLVPQYPHVSPELDQAALETYQRLLPKWKVIGIDCSTISAKRGDLHCISLNIPVLSD